MKLQKFNLIWLKKIFILIISNSEVINYCCPVNFYMREKGLPDSNKSKPTCSLIFNFLGPSQPSLLSEVAVFESEEVENAVQSDVVDTLFGVGHNPGLGMEGDTQTRF